MHTDLCAHAFASSFMHLNPEQAQILNLSSPSPIDLNIIGVRLQLEMYSPQQFEMDVNLLFTHAILHPELYLSHDELDIASIEYVDSTIYYRYRV